MGGREEGILVPECKGKELCFLADDLYSKQGHGARSSILTRLIFLERPGDPLIELTVRPFEFQSVRDAYLCVIRSPGDL